MLTKRIAEMASNNSQNQSVSTKQIRNCFKNFVFVRIETPQRRTRRAVASSALIYSAGGRTPPPSASKRIYFKFFVFFQQKTQKY